MQNTVLSFTERSGHCGATSSDHWSWHPLATSEGDKVISGGSRSPSQTVHLWMSLCWCHFVDVTLSKLISLFHFIDITLKISLCWCHCVDVSLLISLCLCQSVDVTLLTIRYVNEQQLYFQFYGMTDTSKDMTKKNLDLPLWHCEMRVWWLKLPLIWASWGSTEATALPSCFTFHSISKWWLPGNFSMAQHLQLALWE